MGIRDLKQTHTYVTLEVSWRTWNEITAKLREAGYDHVFGDSGEIDMHGLALVPPASESKMTLDPLPLRTCSRCENWVREYAMVTADDKERVSAVCIIHRKRTYGSDTCGQWTKQ